MGLPDKGIVVPVEHDDQDVVDLGHVHEGRRDVGVLHHGLPQESSTSCASIARTYLAVSARYDHRGDFLCPALQGHTVTEAAKRFGLPLTLAWVGVSRSHPWALYPTRTI